MRSVRLAISWGVLLGKSRTPCSFFATVELGGRQLDSRGEQCGHPILRWSHKCNHTHPTVVTRNKCGSCPDLRVSFRKAAHEKVRGLGATFKCKLHKYLLDGGLCHKPLVMTVNRTEEKMYVFSSEDSWGEN